MRYFKGLQKKGPDGRVNWALMASFDIPCRDSLYLRRLRIIQTPWFGVYIHEMQAEDDAHLHDHPWNFYSFILKGGYKEYFSERMDLTFTQSWIAREWPRWSGHYVRAVEGHRIVHLSEIPTYTLVFVGKRQRNWGFWVDGEWIHWENYHTVVGGEKRV